MAQPRRFEAPTSNRGHCSKIDILAHAAKEAYTLRVPAIINEDVSDFDSGEAGQIDPGNVRRDLKDLRRRIGVAADTTSGRIGDENATATG